MIMKIVMDAASHRDITASFFVGVVILISSLSIIVVIEKRYADRCGLSTTAPRGRRSAPGEHRRIGIRPSLPSM
jgi:hypothetical protein